MAATAASLEDKVRLLEHTLSKFLPTNALDAILRHSAAELQALDGLGSSTTSGPIIIPLPTAPAFRSWQRPSLRPQHFIDQRHYDVISCALVCSLLMGGCLGWTATQMVSDPDTSRRGLVKQLLPYLQLLAAAASTCAIASYMQHAYTRIRTALVVILRFALLLTFASTVAEPFALGQQGPDGRLLNSYTLKLLQAVHESNALLLLLPGLLLPLPVLGECCLVAGIMGCTALFGLLYIPTCEGAFAKQDVLQRCCQLVACLLPLSTVVCAYVSP